MSSISEEYIRTIISRIASICNLKEWRYLQENFESIAQNYFGVLIPVNLIGKHEEEEVSIPLMLKLAPTDERYRVSNAVTHMFAKEIYVYSKVLENYHDIQKDVAQDYIIPKCYYVHKEYCEEVIVMQDMRSEDYEPYIHGMFLDFNHVTVSLKSLAKFHAFSYILKDRSSAVYYETAKVCAPLTGKTNKRFMDIMTDRLNKAVQKFEHTEYVPLLEYLKENCAKTIEAAVDSVHDTCICHGDIWKENILFQYEDNNPVSACLIDFQTTRMCSPAFDTLFLIISSTDTELRHKQFYNLLDIYYQTFASTLRKAGLESQKLYSRQAFDDDLKVVAGASFIVANTALWLSCGLQQEGHIISKQVCSTEEEKMTATENYRAILRGIIDDFRTYKYFL